MLTDRFTGSPLTTTLRITAVGTAALAIGLAAMGPAAATPLPTGFMTPIIALELATSPAYFEAVYGLPSDRDTPQRIAGHLRAHYVDFAFIAVYCTFLAASAMTHGTTLARGVVVLAAVVAVADVLETSLIIEITQSWSETPVTDGQLTWLATTTWAKWGTLSVALAALSVPDWRSSTAWSRRVQGLTLVAPLPVTAVAFAHPPFLGEAMAIAIAVAFATLIWRALTPQSSSSS